MNPAIALLLAVVGVGILVLAALCGLAYLVPDYRLGW